VATGYLFKDPWLSELVLKREWQINLQKIRLSEFLLFVVVLGIAVSVPGFNIE